MENIISRRSLISQYNYLIKIIGQELQNYIFQNICPKRSISSPETVRLSDDSEWIEVIENEPAK